MRAGVLWGRRRLCLGLGAWERPAPLRCILAVLVNICCCLLFDYQWESNRGHCESIEVVDIGLFCVDAFDLGTRFRLDGRAEASH